MGGKGVKFRNENGKGMGKIQIRELGQIVGVTIFEKNFHRILFAPDRVRDRESDESLEIHRHSASAIISDRNRSDGGGISIAARKKKQGEQGKTDDHPFHFDRLPIGVEWNPYSSYHVNIGQ